MIGKWVNAKRFVIRKYLPFEHNSKLNGTFSRTISGELRNIQMTGLPNGPYTKAPHSLKVK